MMITAGRFVFFENRSYPTEGFSNRPNPSSKILTSGDGAISLPGSSPSNGLHGKGGQALLRRKAQRPQAA